MEHGESRNKIDHLTLARASNPKLCPSTVSILWFRANRRFPSMTKATCCGIGPWRNAPMSSSRNCRIPHSMNGDCRTHFRICERCIEGMMVENEAAIQGGGKSIQRTRFVGGGGERKEQRDASNTYYITNLLLFWEIS